MPKCTLHVATGPLYPAVGSHKQPQKRTKGFGYTQKRRDPNHNLQENINVSLSLVVIASPIRIRTEKICQQRGTESHADLSNRTYIACAAEVVQPVLSF